MERKRKSKDQLLLPAGFVLCQVHPSRALSRTSNLSLFFQSEESRKKEGDIAQTTTSSNRTALTGRGNLPSTCEQEE